jgi:nitrilase
VVLSANQCLRKGDLPEWITGKAEGEEEKNYEAEKQSRPKLRRKNTVFDEDGNEIVLPDVKTASIDEEEEGSEIGHTNGTPTPTPARLRRQSAITADGFEIALPSPKATSRSAIEEEWTKPKEGEFVSRGGSCIISPMGEVPAGPLWDDDNGLLVYEVDLDDCLRGRLDLDVGGSYSRYEFKLDQTRPANPV